MAKLVHRLRDLFYTRPKFNDCWDECEEQSAWITGGVSVGQTLMLSGAIVSNARRIQINFLSGVLEFSENEGAVALRVEVNFDKKTIMLTSYTHNKWHRRKTVKCPFKRKQNMQLQIRITEMGYELLSEGTCLLRYRHRLPIAAIENVQIKGGIEITSVYLTQRRNSRRPTDSQSEDAELALLKRTSDCKAIPLLAPKHVFRSVSFDEGKTIQLPQLPTVTLSLFSINTTYSERPGKNSLDYSVASGGSESVMSL